MVEKLIAGADFSGAKEIPNDTWLAVGNLAGLGLEITTLKKVGSHRLAPELLALPGLSAVGLDFPFSLPTEFLSFVAEKNGVSEFQSWQQIAELLVFSTFETFLELVTEFKKEPKRLADKAVHKTAQSPLHRGNPSMVQMTYQGIRMLASLDPKRFYVLPFQDAQPEGCAVLEVYPRESLHCFHVADTPYKSKEKKDKDKMLLARRSILDDMINLKERKGAAYRDWPRLSMSKQLEHTAIESDHALDAVIACYTVAIWSQHPEVFTDPLSADDLAVLLEGWIYAPAGAVS